MNCWYVKHDKCLVFRDGLTAVMKLCLFCELFVLLLICFFYFFIFLHIAAIVASNAMYKQPLY